MSLTSPIGRSLRRVDGGEKVTGLTRYAADLALPGMVHVRLVLSPYAHARITRIDTKAAAEVPGVVGVFGAADLKLAKVDPTARSKSPLAVGRALFAGQPVVAVVAETVAVAEDAAALVEVEYEVLPAAVDVVEAMGKDAPRVRAASGATGEEELAMHGAATGGARVQEDVGPNVVSTQHFHRGDVARGLSEADVVVARRYTTPMVHQGYLEPRAVLAAVDPLGGLTVWTSTQALFFTRSEICEVLGLPEHQVKVVATPLGGAFGGKFVLLEPLAAVLALQLRRPVSLVMTRREEFFATTPAPAAVFELTLGAKRGGTLGSVDMSGTNTAFAQIAGESFGVPVEDVRVVNGDTETAPYAGASGGSKITYTVGLAVERAARDARRQLLAIAADKLEAAVDDLEIVDRAVRVRGLPSRFVTLADLAKASMQFGAKYEPVLGRGASATVVRSPAFAAHLAEVAVDTETGRVHVLGHVVVQDVGRVINPAAVDGQIHGGVVQGLGWALLERMAYDSHGHLASATLMDYALPQSDQAPSIETAIVEIPSDHGPFGAKGVGDPPVVGVPAAVASAITDATGQRFTDLPITGEAIAHALRSLGGRS